MNITDWFFLLNSIQSETPFDGAYGNLKRLFDKAAKMYHQVKKQEMKKLSPSRQRCVRSLLYTYNRQDGGVFLKICSVCSCYLNQVLNPFDLLSIVQHNIQRPLI